MKITKEEVLAAEERLRKQATDYSYAYRNTQQGADEALLAQHYLSTVRTDDGEELTCMNIDRLCDAIEDDYQRKIAFLAWENSCVFNERHLRELIAMIRRNQVEALGGR